MDTTNEEGKAAVTAFIDGDDAASETLFSMFGGCDASSVLSSDGEDVLNLLSSFKRNLALLVQKTWVTDSDVALKDAVLYRLEKFRATDAQWRESYEPFLSLIRDAVYLMFGEESTKSDFGEWADRIDPEFGMFWHFISSLPQSTDTWPEDKYRKAICCGMVFLANY